MACNQKCKNGTACDCLDHEFAGFRLQKMSTALKLVEGMGLTSDELNDYREALDCIAMGKEQGCDPHQILMPIVDDDGISAKYWAAVHDMIEQIKEHGGPTAVCAPPRNWAGPVRVDEPPRNGRWFLISAALLAAPFVYYFW